MSIDMKDYTHHEMLCPFCDAEFVSIGKPGQYCPACFEKDPIIVNTHKGRYDVGPTVQEMRQEKLN